FASKFSLKELLKENVHCAVDKIERKIMGIFFQRFLLLSTLFLIGACLGLETEPLLHKDSKTLECFRNLSGSQFLHWILPNDQVLVDSLENNYVIDKLSGDLTILEADKRDTGIYRCVYQSPEGTYGLTMHKIDVWDYTDVVNQALNWEDNLIRGIITAAVTLSIFIGFWLINEWQWVAPESFGTAAIYEKHGIRADEIELMEVPATYENIGFQSESLESIKKSSISSNSSTGSTKSLTEKNKTCPENK
ncbi:hypothetical protein QYM36_010822, partial [Artemia franciscana]